jgi:hypothetical protein
MKSSTASKEMQACIEACLDCYRHCQNTALTHCLSMGGQHVEPNHFRLMMDCAEACRAAAALLINDSPYHAETCGICARICRDCAASCREIGDMDDCTRACEECADACEAMAAMTGTRESSTGARSLPSRAQ